MATPKLVFLAGSTKKGSLNKNLAAYAADQHGAVTLVDLADSPMPCMTAF